MLKRMLHKIIDATMRPYDYDTTYMHEILDTSTPALLKFMLAQGVNLHRDNISKEALATARLVAIQHEDCGPCAQLVVNMALKDGVDATLIRNVIARAWHALPPIIVTTIRFTDAIMAHAPCDDEREALRSAFGDGGLVSLAFSISQTRTYPTIKRVLGHARACERLHVHGEVIPVIKAA
jgi:alkylhydroperoxidase family enzyme